MVTSVGEYSDLKAGITYKIALSDDKYNSYLMVYQDGTPISAFKRDADMTYCYNTRLAKQIYDRISSGLSRCTSKNCTPLPFELGVCSRFIFEFRKVNYTIEKYNDSICGVEIAAEDYYIFTTFTKNELKIPDNMPWVPLTKPRPVVAGKSVDAEFGDDSAEMNIPVRTLAEIGLEKDITWLKNKQYFVVNDDASAEKVIQAIERYVSQVGGPVAYDVETSGLFINMFGKIGSKQKAEIDRINADKIAKGETPYRVDTLTGFILTIQENVSYYFPVRNRKFKNVFEDRDSPIRNQICNIIKSNYTIGLYRDRDDDMARWIRGHDISEFTSDIILMERCRWILTNANIVAHNGIFEWKTTWLYNIDLNLKDDTMVLHKLLYKFNDMSRGNLGERSDLKYLTKKNFGIDQLELTDFFTDYKEDDSGIISANSKRKKKKSGAKIDFSYMDYEGTKAYAPADGDFTLGLYHKFKKDLIDNHRNMEYLYQVEIIMSCAIAYMEFYGHKIDEKKIEDTKIEQQISKLLYEATFRKQINYSNDIEDRMAEDLQSIVDDLSNLQKEKKKLLSDGDTAGADAVSKEITSLLEERTDTANKLRETIDKNEKVINMASPSQVAHLFYQERQIMRAKPGEKESIGKKVLKEYAQMKNEDGSLKYPEVTTYRKWKDLDTLLSKFFDNLPDYMYPGGFIFSSFGQISTATGRMSCSKPRYSWAPIW